MTTTAQTWQYQAHGALPDVLPESEAEKLIRSVLTWGDLIRPHVRTTDVAVKRILVMGKREWRFNATGDTPLGMVGEVVEAWVRSNINWNDTILPYLKQTTVTVGVPLVDGPRHGQM